ncbi:MAG: hypothetical protein QXP02_05440 [Desulfurococcaceae archaeon]
MSSSKPRDIYLPIHALPSCSVSSDCPFLQIVEVSSDSDKYCVAYCKAIGRYLTRSFIKKCELYWSSCPLLKFS